MFCNHRSPRPCLHTFFIVFRRVPPHTFHTFLVNMISHPHGIPPPPVLYTFVIFCYCHLSVILWNSSENLFFPFLSRGIYPPWCIHFQKCMKPAPPQFFWFTLGDLIYIYIYPSIYISIYISLYIYIYLNTCIYMHIFHYLTHTHIYIYV